MQNLKAIFIGIVGNLITPLVVSVGGFALAFFSSATFEAKIIFCNIALSLSIIILMLNHHFTLQRIRAVKISEQPQVYLVEKNVARHIPDPETFNYLAQIHGFNSATIEVISQNEFTQQFSTASTLPSILPHCQAYYKQKIEQDKQKESH